MGLGWVGLGRVDFISEPDPGGLGSLYLQPNPTQPNPSGSLCVYIMYVSMIKALSQTTLGLSMANMYVCMYMHVRTRSQSSNINSVD